MFTDDSRYVLVVTSAPLHDNRIVISERFTNNESLIPSQPLEDYFICCVDIVDGLKTSQVELKHDKVMTSRHPGIFLHQNTLAVLSIQHQCIHVFKLIDGMLHRTHKIGRFAFSSDEMSHSSVFPSSSPLNEKAYSVLKNKLLISLYCKEAERGPVGISKFYRNFKILEELKMWKMQLIDERVLLIKFASQVVVATRVQEPSPHPSFFLFYDFESGQVLSVHENTSSELLEIFQSHPGLFYQAEVYRGNVQAASYDIYSEKILQRFKETIINAKYGGELEARKRILAQLPMQSQILNPSPYLDLSLFSYNDKYISSVERPKTNGDYPIRFYSRKSGILRFEMITPHQRQTVSQQPGRKLVNFVFHPHEPFAISMKRSNDNMLVNFHLRHLPDCS